MSRENDPLPKVEAALARLAAAREKITFNSVAAEAGVARNTLYKNPALRALIDEHRSSQVDARTLSGLHAEITHLRASLEAVATKVRRHEERLRRIERSGR